MHRLTRWVHKRKDCGILPYNVMCAMTVHFRQEQVSALPGRLCDCEDTDNSWIVPTMNYNKPPCHFSAIFIFGYNPEITGYAHVRFLLPAGRANCFLLPINGLSFCRLPLEGLAKFHRFANFASAVERGETDEVFIIQSFSIYITTSSEFCSAKPTFPSRGRLSKNLFVLCNNVAQ